MTDASAHSDTALEHYVTAGLAGRADVARTIVDECLLDGQPPVEVIGKVIAVAQSQIGMMWQEGRISVAQEHIATAVSESCLHHVSLRSGTPTVKGRALMASAEGEWHGTTARLVAAIWQVLGWDVVTVAPSVPASQLHDLALRDQAVVAGVSSSSAATLVGAWKSVTALRAAGMRVIVGGRIFDRFPNLAHTLGADAYDPDPEHAAGWLTEADGSRKMVRPAVLQEEWERLEQVWLAIPAVVEDALQLAPHLAPLAISQVHAREHLWQIASTSVGATLVDDPAVLVQQLQWCRDALAGRGVDESFADVLVAAIDRELPEGSARVRSVLAAAAA